MAAKATMKLTAEQVAAVARALADPRRFAILQQIACADELPCSSLNAHDEISPATISHHIKELADAGLVETVREGRGAKLTLRRDVLKAYLTRLGEI